jgi:hypothetical protein
MKGVFGGKCNRTVCLNQNATWYNHSTRAYYCTECAILLNNINQVDALRIFGHDLCTAGEHKKQ